MLYEFLRASEDTLRPDGPHDGLVLTEVSWEPPKPPRPTYNGIGTWDAALSAGLFVEQPQELRLSSATRPFYG